MNIVLLLLAAILMTGCFHNQPKPGTSDPGTAPSEIDSWANIAEEGSYGAAIVVLNVAIDDPEDRVIKARIINAVAVGLDKLVIQGKVPTSTEINTIITSIIRENTEHPDREHWVKFATDISDRYYGKFYNKIKKPEDAFKIIGAIIQGAKDASARVLES